MSKILISCVPNFSEGRNKAALDEIAQAIRAVQGVALLHIDPGASTNRTVFTFVGTPEDVIEAAFQAIRAAANLIDMRVHSGAHPRMGATDVCPLVPLSGISWQELVPYSIQLARRVGKELDIPVYLYEYSAAASHRKSLSAIREGEYEGFANKMKQPQWLPDFGPVTFNLKSGATVIGVREFLVAYNVNLNSKSVRLANSVAFDVRENGRVRTENGKPTGKPVIGSDGEPERIPGMLKHCKGIGWYVEEYGIAQVSMNLTNLTETPLHKAFEACEVSAQKRGLRVTGSEVVGLLPKKCLVEAGKFFLEKQGRSTGIPEEDLIEIAVKSLGLSELSPFIASERIIELAAFKNNAPLAGLKINEFVAEVSRETPAPGGGSVAALVGSLGAALGAMVANLSAGKRGWEEKIPHFSSLADKLQAAKQQLLDAVDQDTAAFKLVMNAFSLPKTTDIEKQQRQEAIQKATLEAAYVPFKTIQAAISLYPMLSELVQHGNPSSFSDALVGALCVHTCVKGCGYNVQVNLQGIDNQDISDDLKKKTLTLVAESKSSFERIEAIANEKLR